MRSEVEDTQNDFASFDLRMPQPASGHHPCRHLSPCHPLRAPLGQVLSLRNQTLVDGASEKGDAMPADLIAKVLAGDADA